MALEALRALWSIRIDGATVDLYTDLAGPLLDLPPYGPAGLALGRSQLATVGVTAAVQGVAVRRGELCARKRVGAPLPEISLPRRYMRQRRGAIRVWY